MEKIFSDVASMCITIVFQKRFTEDWFCPFGTEPNPSNQIQKQNQYNKDNSNTSLQGTLISCLTKVHNFLDITIK